MCSKTYFNIQHGMLASQRESRNLSWTKKPGKSKFEGLKKVMSPKKYFRNLGEAFCRASEVEK